MRDPHIFKHNRRYGTGNPYDDPEYRDDVEGEFYYIEFGSLTRAAALVSLPVFVLIGFIRPLAGWPVTIVGIGFPLFLRAYFRNARPKVAA